MTSEAAAAAAAAAVDRSAKKYENMFVRNVRSSWAALIVSVQPRGLRGLDRCLCRLGRHAGGTGSRRHATLFNL